MPWNWRKETQIHFSILILIVLPLYFGSMYLGMKEVIEKPFVHDYYPLPISDDWHKFLTYCVNTLLYSSIIYRLFHLRDNAPVYLKRWYVMYTLKGVI